MPNIWKNYKEFVKDKDMFFKIWCFFTLPISYFIVFIWFIYIFLTDENR